MTTATCVHHYRLEPQEPMRQEYTGWCLHCGSTKTFPGDPEMQVVASLRGKPFGRNKPRPMDDDDSLEV